MVVTVLSRRRHILCGSELMKYLSTLVIALVALAVVGTACGRGSEPRGQPTGTVTLDGSSTVFPLSEAVAEEFQKVQRAVRVTVGVSGTGGGFGRFCRGEIDIADASRPIDPPEIDACRKAGIEFIELPVAYDALTVVVHPRNTWADAMTVGELKRMWEPAAQGRVTRWSHVRTSWPDRELHLFGPGVDSGTFDYFTAAIVGREKASRGDYTSSEDDNVLVQGVASDELALGYFGYAYYAENAHRLKAVAIDDGDDANGRGPIAPSPQTVRDGTYRPLARPLFIYVSTLALGRPEVQAFVDYYLAQGGTLASEVGYVPLSEAASRLVRQRLAARITGTMFGASWTQMPSLETLLGKSQTR
jgi:phosphate transport system substrate-binding protein